MTFDFERIVSTLHHHQVAYVLIDRMNDPGRGLYALVDELIDRYHSDLREARIALAWNLLAGRFVAR